MKINPSSKIVLLGLFALCIFLGSLWYQQWKNEVAIENEKKDLQNQIASLGKKNQDLSDSLAYLDSSDFKERVARQQLNLKRDGEVVFGFTDAPTTSAPSSPTTAGQGAPNYEKWVDYFFGTN